MSARLSRVATSSRALSALTLPELPLDSGEVMRQVRMAYHLDGALSPRRDNVVLVLHALTGSADAAGDWWQGLIGSGAAVDTDHWAVLAPNLLGSCYGSTGPDAPRDSAFPALTVRDVARAVALLVEKLGVRRVALVTGGSLGGMVALEFAASFPGAAERALVFAAPAALGAGAIAWSHVQRRALDVGGEGGLELARAIAMLSYRTPRELGARFTRARALGGEFAVQTWLDAHGRRLAARMSATTYRTLIDIMDTHDVSAARGGTGERLRASGTHFTGVGISGDLFCPPEEVRGWTSHAGGSYVEISSVHGHDAFLIEREQVGALLRAALPTTVVAAEVA